MEKVRPWCGQPSDRGRLRNRTEQLLRNCAVDFVETCNVCARKAIIKVAKRIFNFDKIRHIIVISILASLFWNTVYIVGECVMG